MTKNRQEGKSGFVRIAGSDRASGPSIRTMYAYRADPLAEVDVIIAEHPDFALAHAFRAGALATATDKAFEPELIKSVNAAEGLAREANERERLHIAACRAWLDGEWERGIEAWGRASTEYPRELLALQYAHLGDFYLGYSHLLRDRVARVLPHWNRSVSGYGFVEGMYAFGLEEAGEYAKAEQRGREAVAMNRQDGWAVHAVTHVMEMQGRANEGADYLTAAADGWAPNSMFAFHLWWHKALFQIEANDMVSALKLFDENISAADSVRRSSLSTDRPYCGGCGCSGTMLATGGPTSQTSGNRESMMRTMLSTT